MRIFNFEKTNLLNFGHDLVGVPGRGGLHAPGEPQRPGFDLSAVVDGVAVTNKERRQSKTNK